MNTNHKIELFKEYKDSQGRNVTIFTTTARGNCPIKGMIHHTHNDCINSWEDSTEHLHEHLRDNGIPEQFPLPLEKEGYTWEARGWGWESDDEVKFGYIKKGCSWSSPFNNYDPCGDRKAFYVEYIKKEPVFVPDSEETLAKLPVKEGHDPVYRGKGWKHDGWVCYITSLCGSETEVQDAPVTRYPQGTKDIHYWEYVPVVTKMTMKRLNEILGYSVEIVE